MISVSEAQEIIGQHATALAAEAVPLERAHGRILREPVAAAEDMPAFDRSAMDGYAVRMDDTAEDLAVVGEIRAGDAMDAELRPGEAIRILTGARLPGPGLRVVMQEHVEWRDGRIHRRERSAATFVRHRGEDARAGEVLLEPGHLLEATAVALLASMGKTTVQVSRRPKALHVTTGDEIVAPTERPKPGQIRNSNASLIAGLCREHGIAEVTHVHARDDLREMIARVEGAGAREHDVVLISGGSGAGTYDFSADVFAHLGATIHFRAVNVRPGKPLIFGTTAAGQIVLGLPGNALSHFVCFHLFVRRALEGLVARAPGAVMQAHLAEAMGETANARETWWPVRLGVREGRVECRAVAWRSSGDITRLPAANGLMKVPAGTGELVAGAVVEVLETGGGWRFE